MAIAGGAGAKTAGVCTLPAPSVRSVSPGLGPGGALFQAIADLGQSGSCAVVIELGARRTACANGPDDFVAELDDNTASKEHDVGQLRKQGDRVLALRPFSQGNRIVLEPDTGVRLVVG